MRLLLDTHVLIWSLGFSKKLGVSARALLSNPRNEVFASVVSLFEISTKRARGRRGAPEVSAEQVLQQALAAPFKLLLVEAQHAIAAETVAISHPDPFDRLLLAQARVEGLQLVTRDEALASYDDRAIVI